MAGRLRNDRGGLAARANINQLCVVYVSEWRRMSSAAQNGRCRRYSDQVPEPFIRLCYRKCDPTVTWHAWLSLARSRRLSDERMTADITDSSRGRVLSYLGNTGQLAGRALGEYFVPGDKHSSTHSSHSRNQQNGVQLKIENRKGTS